MIYDIRICDDGAGIFHVFEVQIGMNEFDHRILGLLKQQQESAKMQWSNSFIAICISNTCQKRKFQTQNLIPVLSSSRSMGL